MLRLTSRGLYCDPGDFYIDPWRPVERAVITHAHSDHARPGSKAYLCSRTSESLIRYRLGADISLESLAFHEKLEINGVQVSLVPAGHILGSAQVRMEYHGKVAVVSGDYKTDPDISCEAFEPVKCHLFVTESTFGLPIYRWPSDQDLFDEMHTWWRENQSDGKTSVLMTYALGKAQRALSYLDASIGPVALHGAVTPYLEAYRQFGAPIPETLGGGISEAKEMKGKGFVICPPSAMNTPWLKKYEPYSLAFASGWMAVRGDRRRRGVDRGFVLSDHADWIGLNETIRATGAEEVWITHGYQEALARWLNEQGIKAKAVETLFEGESDESESSNKSEEQEKATPA